jgi:signal transduction histidine kinase
MSWLSGLLARCRQHPVVLLAVLAPPFVATIFWHLSASLFLAVLVWIALYGVPAYAPQRHARAVAVAVVVTAVGVLVAMAPVTEAKGRDGVFMAGVTMAGYLGSAWFFGMYQRVRGERVRAEERARLARELHDVMAHTMSGIVVLAGGGRRAGGDQAVEALRRIEETGRRGMADTRALLAALRSPTLADLSTLVDQARGTGLPVEVRTRGDVRDVPIAVGMAAYRIVQESLTNVVRHAGPAEASVAVRYLPRAVEIQVDDDGRGAPATPGNGLRGMLERAQLAGGGLTAGPRPGGGWSVRAVFPA